MDEPKVTDAFRSGHGCELASSTVPACSAGGTERFFGPTYRAPSWSMLGFRHRRRREALARRGGSRVGCGHGLTTLLMAQASANSRFFGFNSHDGSIERARELATKQGIGSVLELHVSEAKIYPGIAMNWSFVFDCLHDMGDPVGRPDMFEQVCRRTAPG